jgi:hypothetical protein
MTDQSPSPEQQPIAVTVDASALPQVPMTAQEASDMIKEESADATALANAVAKVDLAFPAVGFIDPTVQLEKMRQLAAAMPEDARRAYPEAIRAKLIAYHAAPKEAPAVSDDELALAIFIRRTTDSPLTVEEVEAKTTGKLKKEPKEPKTPRAKKAAAEKPAQSSLDDILGL